MISKNKEEQAIAVSTIIGTFSYGRDTIFLKKIEYGQVHLTFICNVDSDRVSFTLNKKDCISFKLIFTNIIFWFTAELDTYEAIVEDFPKPLEAASGFEKIENSKYLKELPIRKDYKKQNFHHFVLWTYDEVFQILAADYKMEIL